MKLACIKFVIRSSLNKEKPLRESEALFSTHTRLLTRHALALTDDAEKASEVYTVVKNRFGAWQADTVRICNEGAHKGFAGDDPVKFVRNVEQLAENILTLS